MKTAILLLTLVLTLLSCNQDSPKVIGDTGSNESETIPPSTSEDFILERSGTFVSRNGYSVAGTAELHYSSSTNVYSLRFTNFTSQNGPALRVYLSQDETESSIINLGTLKSTNGEQSYDFSASSYDPDKDTVIIWCDAINQPFGVAIL